MKIDDTERAFVKFVESRDFAVEALSPADGLTVMAAFFRSVRFDGIAAGPDDSLRYQWGVADRGQGEHFELNLVRVVVRRATPSAPAETHELELTWRFAVDAWGRAITNGSRWCRTPAELPEFETFVRDSPAFTASANEFPLSVSLHFGPVG